MVSFKSLKKVGVIGLMSGTSLDGLDLCFAEFEIKNKQWTFVIKATKGISYSTGWRNRLNQAFFTKEEDFKKLETDYGTFLGSETSIFMDEQGIKDEVHLVASHGHTVFHEPSKGITVQIGDGAQIAKLANKPVINNFRIKDVQLGGQGAPLVPVGDAFLFSEYDACLNLGGIANVSYQQKKQRLAFDIAPCNLPLNKIMRNFYQKEFDENGDLAQSGDCIEALLSQLDQLAYYKLEAPKSLAVEWLNKQFDPILQQYMNDDYDLADVMHTIIQHETKQIAQVLNANKIKTVLVTGGGAYNGFFMEELINKSKAQIIKPTNQIVEFKEALIFAFLGLLNVLGETNTFKSVTGATHDSIGGFVTYP
ncbi:MAG: anhydro-N-acetylmuramic acid kinase [Crocinitomix sp.]|nr:anhydro-N-acetylmuramic acid kinase [Crocinitomix sp.]